MIEEKLLRLSATSMCQELLNLIIFKKYILLAFEIL